MKKVLLFSNWHGGVMVKAVVQGGEDRFPAGPRALLSWFQSGRKGLGIIIIINEFIYRIKTLSVV